MKFEVGDMIIRKEPREADEEHVFKILEFKEEDVVLHCLDLERNPWYLSPYALRAFYRKATKKEQAAAIANRITSRITAGEYA